MWYIYHAMLDADIVEDAIQQQGGSGSVDEQLFHEIGVRWIWTVNKHFQVIPRGYIILPGGGTEDVAETEFTCGSNGGGTDQCDGDDTALVGEIRMRVRF